MKLEKLSLPDLGGLVALDAATNLYPWTVPLWRDTLAQQHAVGFRGPDGQLSGAAVFSQVLDEAELMMIAIAPTQQGQGLGRALLDAVLTQLATNGVRAMFLEVRASNHRAQMLYQSAGANEIGQRRNYYPCASGREDAYLYAFYLSTDA